MRIKNIYLLTLLNSVYCLALFFISLSVFADIELSLNEAESIALENDPVIAQYHVRAEALSARAIAAGQLPDPELSFGLAEVPLNNFDLGDHEDTELRLGLSQAFPPGRTLQFRTERMEALAGVEKARASNQRLLVLNEVRNAYIELYYQQEALLIIGLNHDLFEEMVEITEGQYTEGRDNQHDVLRAQLELSLIEDRIEETRGAIELERAELAKWVRHEHAIRPLSKDLPELPSLIPVSDMIDQLSRHPLLTVEDAEIEAAQKSVAIAKEQYKPRWMIDFMVSENTGSAFDLRTGPDFAGVFLKMSLPIFTNKRQDKQLAASRQEAIAARYNRIDHLRELVRRVETEYANLNRLEHRLQLYRQRARVEAEQTHEATFNAYQNDLVDFETLVRARILALETNLTMLRIHTNYLKSHVNLLYLAGERS